METRAYATSDDLQRMLDLLMACRQMQPEGDVEHVGDLLWAFRRQTEPERDVHLREESGSLAGFTVVDPAWGMVHCQARPDVTGSLERVLLDWGLERLRQAAREERRQATAWVQVREGSEERMAFLASQGFSRDDATVTELLRPLDQPIPSPRLPDGFTIRPLAGEGEVEAYVDLHRDAWSVWAPSTYSVEQHLRLMRRPGYEIDLNPVAVAPDGSLASGCIGWLDPVNKIAEIEPLGTRPAYARRGLARAVVLDLLLRMRAHGMETALVYGTHRNDAAWNLYHSLGFQPGRAWYSYRREL